MGSEFIVGLLVLLLMLIALLHGIHYERKVWNDGICIETGKPWKHFDTDSQGGRGYESGDYYIWIGWYSIP